MYKIVKVAENNVEVYYSKQVEIVDNGVGLAWDKENPDVYGKDRLEKELAEVVSQKSVYNLKTTCPKCLKELEVLNNKETKLLTIKEELEK